MKNHNNQPGICRSDCPNGNTGSSDQISQTNKNGIDQAQMIKHYIFYTGNPNVTFFQHFFLVDKIIIIIK